MRVYKFIQFLNINLLAFQLREQEMLLVFSYTFNPIQDGHFRDCSRIGGEGGGGQQGPFPKICHTYPTMMKLGTVLPYLKKIQKIFESRDTPTDFC